MALRFIFEVQLPVFVRDYFSTLTSIKELQRFNVKDGLGA